MRAVVRVTVDRACLSVRGDDRRKRGAERDAQTTTSNPVLDQTRRSAGKLLNTLASHRGFEPLLPP